MPGPKRRSTSGASKLSEVSTHSQGQASVNQSPVGSGSEDFDEVDDVQNRAGANTDPANPEETFEEAEEPDNTNGDEAVQDENNGDHQQDVEEPTRRHRDLKDMLNLRIKNCGKEQANVKDRMTTVKKGMSEKDLIRLKAAINGLKKAMNRVKETRKDIHDRN